MRCDIIALGLIAAVQELSLKIPLIVRLQVRIFHEFSTNFSGKFTDKLVLLFTFNFYSHYLLCGNNTLKFE